MNLNVFKHTGWLCIIDKTLIVYDSITDKIETI